MATFTVKRESNTNFTPEQVQTQLNMYGMKYEDMAEYFNNNLAAMLFAEDAESAKGRLTLCMLSDVQEMILRDLKEEARQLINRVKYLMHVDLVQVEEES